jgi:hypothetical protein
VIDADEGELTITVDDEPSTLGWEELLFEMERYLALVDIVILDGPAWDSEAGHRIELLLREALPAQGVPVVHVGDPLLARWRASSPRPRRGPGRRRRSASPW